MMGFLKGQINNNPFYHRRGRCEENPEIWYLCVPFSRDARYSLGLENRTWGGDPGLVQQPAE